MKHLSNAYYRIIILSLLLLDVVLMAFLTSAYLYLVAILLLLPWVMYEVYCMIKKKTDKVETAIMRLWWIAPSFLLFVSVFDTLPLNNEITLIDFCTELLAWIGLVAFVWSLFTIIVFSCARKVKQVICILLMLVLSLVVYL